MEIRYIDPVYLFPKTLKKIDYQTIIIFGTNNGVDYFSQEGKRINSKQILDKYYNFKFIIDEKPFYANILSDKIYWEDGVIWTKYRN